MSDASKNNMKVLLKLEAVAKVMSMMPFYMAVYYANGGVGVGQAVVGDRFQGQGNARFIPLSRQYFLKKQGQAKELNKAAKAKYGKGSKLIEVPFKSKTGKLTGFGAGKNLPILVLTGKMRAAIVGRKHGIVQEGDVATITFKDLPPYAKWHHTGTKRGLPKRSPVEPDEADTARVVEYANRRIKAAIGDGSALTEFGLGTPRIF